MLFLVICVNKQCSGKTLDVRQLIIIKTQRYTNSSVTMETSIYSKFSYKWSYTLILQMLHVFKNTTSYLTYIGLGLVFTFKTLLIDFWYFFSTNSIIRSIETLFQGICHPDDTSRGILIDNINYQRKLLYCPSDINWDEVSASFSVNTSR